MNEHSNNIDNPDQRITEDVTNVSHNVYELYSSVLSAFFGCAMWTHVLFSLGNPNVVVVCMGSCLFRTAVAMFGFMTRLVESQRAVLYRNAELRYRPGRETSTNQGSRVPIFSQAWLSINFL